MASSLPIKNKSGYLIYCGDVRETIQSSHPDIKSVEIVKKMGVGWKALSDVQRKEYETRASQDKERFLREKEEWTAANPGVVVSTQKKTRKRTKKEDVVVEQIVVEDHELIQEPPVVSALPKKRGKKAAVVVAAAAAATAVVQPETPPAVAVAAPPADDKKKHFNKFQNFCSIQRAKLKVDKPQLKPKEVTTEVNAMWKALTPQEQDGFIA